MRSNDRVRVLINFLGRLSRVEMEVEALEPTEFPTELLI